MKLEEEEAGALVMGGCPRSSIQPPDSVYCSIMPAARDWIDASIIEQYAESGGWIDGLGQPPITRAPASSSSNFIRAFARHRHRHQSYCKRCLDRESCRKLNECLTLRTMQCFL